MFGGQSGEYVCSRGGPAPPLFSWTKLRPKGPKNFWGGHRPPLSKGLDDRPPPPRPLS